MGLYSKYMLPRVVDFACGLKPNMKQRQKVVPRANGRVLEIGVGSGLNFSFYDPERVTGVVGLDPSVEMFELVGDKTDALPFPVEFVEGVAEEIPLGDHSVDTVLVTYTLCTILDVVAALRDMRRVLKDDGTLIFCEHGLAPDENVRKWQHRLNPVWNKLGGGCNLNRNIPALLQDGGFRIRDMDQMYLPGFKPASFNYWGTAA